jgi:putative toxin-antitoxin system antitoxin component (TIGR02293 family)
MKEYKFDNTLELALNEPAALYGFSFDSDNLIQFARRGLTMNYLQKLAISLSLNLQEISEILHVSIRTLQRYTATKKLDTDISSKLLNLTALHNHGVSVFGSEADFNCWLKSPVSSLQNNTPLSFLDTPFGFTMVGQVLGRIEHGIFA